MESISVARVAPSSSLSARLAATRARSIELCAGLAAEDLAAQSMPDASPLKWHLAHATWFFETFVLTPYAPAYRTFDPAYEWLFNSYYDAVGPQYPRAQRGLLTRPALGQVLRYREHVDTALGQLLLRPLGAEPRRRIELGLQHEQQHQELMVADLKHLLAQNPLQPAWRSGRAAPSNEEPLRWLESPGGIGAVGADDAVGAGFAFDNERPRHRVLLRPHAVASRPVSNAEYREFINDDGYRRPELWLADGWAAVQAGAWRRPLYWSADLTRGFTVHGTQPLDPHAPVCHVSYYEADACARWAGARLPTEFEWENAASGQPVAGQFAESDEFHPRTQASLYGSVWTWTASAYTAYPGYRAVEGALGEYNAKFMCNQWVLRGGSCATPREHVRASYRNFFYPHARWQFSGLRLAKDR